MATNPKPFVIGDTGPHEMDLTLERVARSYELR